MKKTTIILFVFLFGLVACKSPQELEVETVPMVPKAIVVLDWSQYGGSAPIGLDNVVVTGNKMKIDVKYSGGCEKHSFQLIGHKMVAKSIPPQRSIKLYHNDNGDSCRELIEETLEFDISAFAVDNGEVSLRLESYDKPITYIPVK